ncbi:MAG: hypothetical protein WAZ18_07515 [Alphaproteobacteria bacterium]
MDFDWKALEALRQKCLEERNQANHDADLPEIKPSKRKLMPKHVPHVMSSEMAQAVGIREVDSAFFHDTDGQDRLM